MRHETITWYLTVECNPKHGNKILFTEHNGKIHVGYFLNGNYESEHNSMPPEYVKEWAEIETF